MKKKIVILMLLMCVSCFAIHYGSSGSWNNKCKICSQPVFIWKQTSYIVDVQVTTAQTQSDVLLDGESGGSISNGNELLYSTEIAVCNECYGRYNSKFTNALNKTVDDFFKSAIAENKCVRKKNQAINDNNRLDFITEKLESLYIKRGELEKSQAELRILTNREGVAK